MPTTQRTIGGKFAPGNAGGPGRPPRQTETAYLSRMMRVCDLDTWETITRAAVAAAQAGDHQARAWLSSFLVGKAETIAPKPTAVVVAELLGGDAALELAAKEVARPLISARRYPSLGMDDEDADIIGEAKRELLKAEARRRATEGEGSQPETA